MNRIGLLGSSALRSAAFLGCALAVATPAFAQDAQTEDTAAEEETLATLPEEAAVETTDESDAIVVTGSRIRTVTPFNSPDPISIIEPEIALKEGKFDTASMLQSSPTRSGPRRQPAHARRSLDRRQAHVLERRRPRADHRVDHAARRARHRQRSEPPHAQRDHHAHEQSPE